MELPTARLSFGNQGSHPVTACGWAPWAQLQVNPPSLGHSPTLLCTLHLGASAAPASGPAAAWRQERSWFSKPPVQSTLLPGQRHPETSRNYLKNVYVQHMCPPLRKGHTFPSLEVRNAPRREPPSESLTLRTLHLLWSPVPTGPAAVCLARGSGGGAAGMLGQAHPGSTGHRGLRLPRGQTSCCRRHLLWQLPGRHSWVIISQDFPLVAPQGCGTALPLQQGAPPSS